MKNNKSMIFKKRSSRSKRERAQAMVVAFIYISVASLMAIYMISYANNLHQIVVREINHSRAFYAGQSGLVRALADLTAGETVSDQNIGGITVTTNSAGVAQDNRVITSTVNNWL
jgi:hypothetical protein